MKDQIKVLAGIGTPEIAAAESELDLVVPFTDPCLTKTAMAAADRLGEGLHAVVRLVRVQPVPFPSDLDQSPVSIHFLRTQLKNFRSALPMQAEIRLARDFREGLMSALCPGSVVVLASKRRWWTTRTERLAAALRRAGHQTVLVFERDT